MNSLGDVTPRFSAKQMAECCSCQMVFGPKFFLGCAFSAPKPDLADQSCCQASAGIPFASDRAGALLGPVLIAARPALRMQTGTIAITPGGIAGFLSVIGVSLSRACREMGRFKAVSNVARVLDLGSARDWTNEEPVRQAVDLLGSTFIVDETVATVVDVAGPEQTFAASDAVLGKASFNGDSRRILAWHRLTPSGGVVPPAATNSAGVSCVNCTMPIRVRMV